MAHNTWKHAAAAAALILSCIQPSDALAASARCPTVGAIRWDAWFGAKGAPGRAVEQTLGPSRWHGRLPTCARVTGPDSVEIACDSAEQLLSEAELAKGAGIGYWAFVAYDDGDPMSLGLKTYLNSRARQLVNFALISEVAGWGDKTRYKKVIERFAKLMADSAYQRTPSGRPIFFLGFITDEVLNQRFGGRQAFAGLVGELRQLTQQAGAANPYIVLLDRQVGRAKGLIQDLGLDAVSAYAVADIQVEDGEYRRLADMTADFWRQAVATGIPLLPIAMTGWDRRPRIQNPVPWEQGRISQGHSNHFYRQPTMTELAEHLSSALRAASGGNELTSAFSVLVYAWNEFDEGGWLAPTYGDGTRRLDAVRQAVEAACPAGSGTR